MEATHDFPVLDPGVRAAAQSGVDRALLAHLLWRIAAAALAGDQQSFDAATDEGHAWLEQIGPYLYQRANPAARPEP